MAKILVEDKYGNRWYKKVVDKESETTFILGDNDKELGGQMGDVIENKSVVKVKKLPAKEEGTVQDTNVKKPRKPYTFKKKGFDLHDIPLPVIRIASVIISVIAIIRSFGYIFSYFTRVDIPFFAVLMALLLVLVSFLSPQVFLISIKQKKYFVTLLSTCIFLVFMYINIFVTTSGLSYARNQSDYYVASGQENIVKAKRRLEELVVKETRIMTDYTKDGKEYDTLLIEFDRLTAEGLIGTANYNNTRTRLAEAKKRYDADKASLELIDTERIELNKVEGIDSVIIKTEDIKKKESSIDLVFAIALDIAGPIFMAFALFL